jgi:hypothetical protein
MNNGLMVAEDMSKFGLNDKVCCSFVACVALANV